MVFAAHKYSLSRQLADLGRKTAAVYLKIVRQLLTVKWYIKAAATRRTGFH